jgi:hypothetical protein
LGGLPLALTQAAGYTRTNRIGLAAYLRLYHDRSGELLTEGRPSDYPHTVATTWQIAIDHLSDSAREMLNILAFYAPDAIPLPLIFASVDELDRYRTIGELLSYSLVSSAEPGTLTIHQLVQAVTRDRLHRELTSHEWAEKARKLITASIPEDDTAIALADWNRLHTHVRALLGYLPAEHPSTLVTRSALAHWIGVAGDWTGAWDLLAELLPIRTRVLGKHHPLTLDTRHKLATWVGEAGDARLAREMMTNLLPIRERVLGVEHPDTLDTRHHLARWIGNIGEAAAARDMLAELLPIRERILGEDHPDTLSTRNSLASWTGEAGDPALARDMLTALLPIRERVLGADHRYTLTTRNNLAHWTGMAGDPARARDMLAELIPVRARALDSDNHPNVLIARLQMAYWTAKAGEIAAVQELYTKLRPLAEDILGADHPELLTLQGLLGG